MEALSRAVGLPLGESRVHVAEGEAGELAPAGIAAPVEKVNRARRASNATGDRITETGHVADLGRDPTTSRPSAVSRIGPVSNDAVILPPPVTVRLPAPGTRREVGPDTRPVSWS